MFYLPIDGAFHPMNHGKITNAFQELLVGSGTRDKRWNYLFQDLWHCSSSVFLLFPSSSCLFYLPPLSLLPVNVSPSHLSLVVLSPLSSCLSFFLFFDISSFFPFLFLLCFSFLLLRCDILFSLCFLSFLWLYLFFLSPFSLIVSSSSDCLFFLCLFLSRFSFMP